MTRTDRLSHILSLLAESESVTVDELVESLRISPATARRDLDSLAQQRLIRRIHGGGTRNAESFDLSLRARFGEHSDAKRAIARRASDLVGAGAVVGLTGGTTLSLLAEEIARGAHSDDAIQPLTVVTNAINVASLLVLRPRIKVVVPGGIVHSRSFELTGPLAEQALMQFSLDVSFIGVNAFDFESGAMVRDDQEARVNQLMLQRSQRAYILADSGKLGRRAFVSIGALSAFHGIVTDDGISQKAEADLASHGLEVIVARRSAS